VRHHAVICATGRSNSMAGFFQAAADPSKVERVHAGTLLETSAAKNQPWSDADGSVSLADRRTDAASRVGACRPSTRNSHGPAGGPLTARFLRQGSTVVRGYTPLTALHRLPFVNNGLSA